MNVLDQLPDGTTPIFTCDANGAVVGVGTGFFFQFTYPGDLTASIVVTNKHVLKNGVSVKMFISSSAEDDTRLSGSQPISITMPIDQLAIQHPNKDIDLAAFPLTPVMTKMAQSGSPIFVRHLHEDNIPSIEVEKSLSAIENIFMVGYPSGIWDQKNNYPIVRRGITASPYFSDYQGKREFAIDCACFPGSSGSPIVLADNGWFQNKQGDMVLGKRVYLLGVLWGGAEMNPQGKMTVETTPTTDDVSNFSRINLNLGYCIKASEILIFKDELAKQLNNKEFKIRVGGNGIVCTLKSYGHEAWGEVPWVSI